MSEVKNFRIIGRIEKPNLKTIFKKEIRALKPEHAIEELYKIIGSKHRVKRFQIKIDRIEEVPPEEEA
ncbi:50S ribosomal protein L18a [Candidatus Bathyarchaeota archaeon]|nr:50S ribosomal protein L18a [Candidatus Bathyarchaeota archaeon]